MQACRILAPLLAVLLTACPPSNPPPSFTDGGTQSTDGGGTALALDTVELPAASVGQPYRATLTASGGSPGYSWHLVSGALPQGLALSSAGELAGTPSASGSASFTLEVRDSLGETARGTFDLTVLGVQVSTSSLSDAYLGSEYSASLTASGGTAPYTWVIASGALPAGLRLGTQGLLSGAPVASGAFSVIVLVRDASGASASRELALSVFAPPSLSSAALPPAVLGVPYSAGLNASGGRPPLTLRISSGALPEGLHLEAHTVFGTPTTAGTASFTAEVRDANGRSTSVPFQLPVRIGLTVTSTTLPDAYTGSAYGSALSAAGGQPPYAWTLVTGSLPTGLRLLGSGTIDGTPSSTGTASFTVRVTDAENVTDTRQVSLTTYAPPTLAAVSAQSTYTGDSVSLAFSASGGKTPFTFSAAGTLPPGLSLMEQGLLHGKPTQPGAFAFDITARDANGRTATRPVSFSVHTAPSITTLSLTDGDTGVAYSATLSASGGRGALTWTLDTGTLPAGLTLGSDGVLSGTPSDAGISTFVVRATDTGGRSDIRALSLTVYGAPTLTTSTVADGYVGASYSATLTATGGRTPRTWTLDSGALPQGITLDASTGVLSGTPSTSGTASFVVRVTANGGRNHSRALTLAVYRPPTLTSPALQQEGYVSESFSTLFSASDGKPPYTFFTSEPLPAWLQLAGDGRLSGTPALAGFTSLQVNVSDANGRTSSRALALTTYALPSITTSSLTEAHLDEPYSATLNASGGKASLHWSLASGALPTGLSLSGSGIVSGTPTGGGTTFSVRVTDANTRSAERTFTLAVYVPPHVTTASLPDAMLDQPYSVTLTASNGRAPLVWSVSGSLPAGLTLSPEGVLSGTPTEAGTVDVTVSVRDAENRSDSRALPLTVRTSGAGAVFTLGHWNIEWFGANGMGPPSSTSDGGTPDDLQMAHARDILADAGVNLWGLVEIVDSEDFATLKSQLPGYSGFLANDTAYVPGGSSWYHAAEQKPGILYDDSLTYVGAEIILTQNVDDFGGRPPLRVNFTTRVRGTTVSLVVIVLHMKAFDDVDSYDKRGRASAAIKDYIDQRLPSDRVFVIGDWNDDVDRSITRVDGGYLASPFEPLLLDTANYTFITQPLSLSGQRTTASYRDVIDHTLATNELAADYVSGSVRVLRPDAWIPNYANIVSDHYPVISRYNFGSGGGGSDGGTGPGPTPGHVFINEFLPNEPIPPGGTVGDPHYEFVELVNAGSDTVDISGWSLKDDTLTVTARHVFAPGTTLAPGKAFVVFGGSRGFPAGTPATVAASSGQLGLNNDGDTLSLLAPDGGVVDVTSYTSTVDAVSYNRMPDATPDGGFVLHTQVTPGRPSSAGLRADGGVF